jgi:hypothetical protein
MNRPLRLSVQAVLVSACAAAPQVRPIVIAGDAAPLLDAWATAAGGRDALSRLAAVQITGTLELGGLTGEFATWETARGERRYDETLGAAGRTTDVFDGARGWEVDRNRQVRALDGVDLEDQVALAYLGAQAPLVAARRPGRISRAGDALRLEPDGGRPLTIAFDPATHLPATIARRDEEKTRVITLSDWRTVGAVRFPYTIRDDDGDPRDTRVLHVQAIAVDRAPPATAFARPADAPPDAQFAAGGSATMPLELARALIFVEARINGSPPLAFILDTGAEVTVINASRLARLGLAPIGELAVGAGGGDAAMSYVKDVSFALPGVTLRGQTVTAIPLDALEGPLGHPIDGILGYDFLSRFVVEIDYPGKTLRLYDRAIGHRPAGEPQAIQLGGLVPSVRATAWVAGTPLTDWFVVDTGCNCEVSFNAPFTAAHRLLESTPRQLAANSRGAGGENTAVLGRIAGISIGGLHMSSPVASFTRGSVGANADPTSAGLLGGELWQRFVVTFDYDRRTMWLAKTAGYERPVPMVGAGVQWEPRGDGFAAVVVRDGTPAAEAGLAAGDILVSVDGTPAAQLTLPALDAMFHKDGARHAVVVRRDTTQHDLTITPRELL